MKTIYLKKVPRFPAALKGMAREIRKCNECGRIFAYYYLPYGISKGYRINSCICVGTSYHAENNVTLIKKRKK